VTFHTQGPLPPLPQGPGVPSLTGAIASRHDGTGGPYIMQTPQSARGGGAGITSIPMGLSSQSTAYNDFFQRLLRRSGTAGGGGGRAKGVARHPIAQSYSSHYYDDPGPPTNRSGNMGSSWRHVKQCTGNLGNHICFIDGVVKQQDGKFYPPFGHTPTSARQVNLPVNTTLPVVSRSMNVRPTNRYAQNAQHGHKYWHEDRKAMPSGPKPTISGHLMKLGIGH